MHRSIGYSILYLEHDISLEIHYIPGKSNIYEPFLEIRQTSQYKMVLVSNSNKNFIFQMITFHNMDCL